MLYFIKLTKFLTDDEVIIDKRCIEGFSESTDGRVVYMKSGRGLNVKETMTELLELTK